MELLIGLDVGTTAVKALLIDLEGNLISLASYKYKLITPHNDWVEQDPEDLWQGVVFTIKKIIDDLKPSDHVIALSISSQGGTTIPVDELFRPVYNAISWMDHRAHKQAERMRKEGIKIYETTGWDIYDGLPLLHISWLRENEPKVFSSARYFLFVNDFIIYRLTEKLCMDPSNAGITQLFNIAELDWDKDMLNIAEVAPEQLSPVKNSGFAIGNITQKASHETGLSESVLVVNGAHDQYCAALGAGVLEPGDVLLSCGTAWVILGVMDELKFDPNKILSISPHVVPNRWGALKSMGAVGACIEWFLDNILPKMSDRTKLYAELNKSAERASPGSKGLIFLPSSGGYGHGVRGGFIGLSISHSCDNMARAIMEGIAFDLRCTIDDILKSGIRINNLRMVGGAASSPIWTKIVADITKVPVILPSLTQSASYGAAILAGFGSRVFNNLKSAYQKLAGQENQIEPNTDNGRKYDDLYEIYRSALQKNQQILSKLSEIN
ncbi:MAG: xylulokinase [bacterium]